MNPLEWTFLPGLVIGTNLSRQQDNFAAIISDKTMVRKVCCYFVVRHLVVEMEHWNTISLLVMCWGQEKEGE